MDLFLMIAGSAVVGVAVGMLSGMLGVGGGTVLVPVFKLLYGMPAIAATATSLFTIIPTSLSGVVTHVRNKSCIPALGVAAGVGGAAMSPLGVWLANISPEWSIMLAAALVIGYSATTMFRKAVKLWRVEKAASGQGADGGAAAAAGAANACGASDSSDAESCGSAEAARASEERDAEGAGCQQLPSRRRIMAVGFCIGLFAGVVSGYVGVGGGFIMVPLFMQILGTPMKKTSGTSLIAVMILAVPGTVAQAMLGNVDWLAGILIAVGTIPGAAIGSRLMARVSELALRFGFAAFLLVAAVLLVLNQLKVF